MNRYFFSCMKNYWGGYRARIYGAAGSFMLTCVLPFLIAAHAGVVVAQATEPVAAKLLIQALPAVNDPPQSFRVLSYHDIRDNLTDSLQTQPEPTAVDTKQLIQQFTWLKENGYHPVSLQQIIDARAGRTMLPDKALLLTFDDGLISVYTKVFPLLKLFNFPAVIAIVGEWMETPQNQQVKFGDHLRARDQFVNWNQIRTMVSSGLIEVASHSRDLHKGIVANPQGNSLPAAVSRIYFSSTASYESDADYSARIGADLQRNSDLIERELHQRPRALVWPYGSYNQQTLKLAAQAGMTVTMNLDPGPNTPTDTLMKIKRTLINFNTRLADLIQILHQPVGYTGHEVPFERVIHIDLDYIYDPDPVQQEANLSRMLERINRLRPTTVYLQAFADPDGDGVANAVYFPNRHLPMRADLFSRVAWQLSSRVDVKVYAWMPVMAFKLPASDPAAARVVQIMPGAPAAASAQRYHRLSPFDPLVRQTLIEIYEDLGKSSIFDGILFHDDATLSDYEDASPAALDYYRHEWQLPDSVAAIRQSPKLRQVWAEKKSAYIDALTLTLADKLREYQPALLTARNIYAQPVLNPAAQEWFAQSLTNFLASYDFTVIMAMPYMEGATDATVWLNQLRQKIQAIPHAADKTVFELQSRDWNTGQPIPAQILAAQLRQLHLNGVRNFGYYPDDFQANVPEEDVIKPVISVETK